MTCVEAPGGRGAGGYGRVTRNYVTTLAHRQAWEDTFGPIPEGLDIHHRCGNKGCVNLDHLMAVTRAEHMRLHRKEHCKRGHPRTPENVWKNGACKPCGLDYQRERRSRKRA
jgi:hypothetical protein